MIKTRDQLNARLAQIGMRKSELARILGRHIDYVSQYGHRREVPRYVLFAVEAWHQMSGPQRLEVLKHIGALDEPTEAA